MNEPGQLSNLLKDFGGSPAAFWRDPGDRMEDVLVVTRSEFGRTAKENGNRGTDHGHANVMSAMGGGVRGGKVYGEWPGLAREQLYEARDLNLPPISGTCRAGWSSAIAKTASSSRCSRDIARERANSAEL